MVPSADSGLTHLKSQKPWNDNVVETRSRINRIKAGGLKVHRLQHTRSKSVEGKQRVGSNAYKGGHRSKLRKIIKLANAEVRASRELVSRL